MGHLYTLAELINSKLEAPHVDLRNRGRHYQTNPHDVAMGSLQFSACPP